MTYVEYVRDKDGHRLHIDGHAGYDSTGCDIVCAGVSAVCFALLGFLENFAADTSDYTYMSGQCIVTSCSDYRVDAAFDMAVLGLMQIAHKYPDYVNIHISAPGGDSRE